MKLFVDDIGQPPDDTWTLATSISQAIDLLRRYGLGDFRTPGITHVSLDHDISIPFGIGAIPSPDTFKVVAYFMQEMMSGTNPSLRDDIVITTHSSNPAGRKEIVAIFEEIEIDCEEKPLPIASRAELST